jgi:hypothetical protein
LMLDAAVSMIIFGGIKSGLFSLSGFSGTLQSRGINAVIKNRKESLLSIVTVLSMEIIRAHPETPASPEAERGRRGQGGRCSHIAWQYGEAA